MFNKIKPDGKEILKNQKLNSTFQKKLPLFGPTFWDL